MSKPIPIPSNSPASTGGHARHNFSPSATSSSNSAASSTSTSKGTPSSISAYMNSLIGRTSSSIEKASSYRETFDPYRHPYSSAVIKDSNRGFIWNDELLSADDRRTYGYSYGSSNEKENPYEEPQVFELKL